MSKIIKCKIFVLLAQSADILTYLKKTYAKP